MRSRTLELAFALLVVCAAPARAHLHLHKSVPAAGERLATSPDAIRLWFTERPETAMTVVELADSAGRPITVGAMQVDPADPLSVRFGIGESLAPGRYTVTWRAVADDGHPAKGSFSFRVLVPPPTVAVVPLGPVAAADTLKAAPRSADSAEDRMEMGKAGADDSGANSVVYVMTRFVSFTALLLLIGATAFYWVVLRPVAEEPAFPRAVSGIIATRAAGVGVAAGVVVLASAAMRLSLQQTMMTEMLGSRAGGIGSLISATQWGRGWMLQVVSAVLAVIGFALARRAVAVGWAIATLGAIVASCTPALQGHAIASENARSLAVAVDTLHVIGASGWLGSLFCLVAVALPSIARSQSEGPVSRAELIRALVVRFSPTALVFAGLLVGSGLLNAWLRLGSIPALWQPGYGQMLIRKLVFFAGVLGTGAYNWLRVKPALGTDAATARLKRSGGAELAIAIVVLAITAVLVAMPTPVSLR